MITLKIWQILIIVSILTWIFIGNRKQYYNYLTADRPLLVPWLGLNLVMWLIYFIFY